WPAFRHRPSVAPSADHCPRLRLARFWPTRQTACMMERRVRRRLMASAHALAPPFLNPAPLSEPLLPRYSRSSVVDSEEIAGRTGRLLLLEAQGPRKLKSD